MKLLNHPKALLRIGGPKFFYDKDSSRYVVTWHTIHDLSKTDLPELYWEGQRTIYATPKDLKTFQSR